ncbi:MAG: hypothetical protein GEU74_11555 [Nitriliruptorales bacterium]|nr:hypothetical protein [Nitriliruptorales bacterium]
MSTGKSPDRGVTSARRRAPESLTVSLQPASADRLEVNEAPTPDTTRCFVVGGSPTYRLGLGQALRDAGFATETADQQDGLGAVCTDAGRRVLLVVLDSATDAPPSVGDDGLLTVALLPDAQPASYSAALRAGWNATVPSDGPPELIVAVVRGALEGRRLLPRDVARQLASARDAQPAVSLEDAVEATKAKRSGSVAGRQHSDITELPTREEEHEIGAWLTALPAAPIGTDRHGAGSITGSAVRPAVATGAIRFVYTDRDVRYAPGPQDETIIRICDEVERCRQQVGIVDGMQIRDVLERSSLRGYVFTGEPVAPTTSVMPDELLQIARPILPEGVSAGQFHQAQVDVWHDLLSGTIDPRAVTAFDSPSLTWGGLAPDGQLQSMIRTLFARSQDARRLFLQVGVMVQNIDQRPMFVAVDTSHGWRLYGHDAERYIRADARLLSLLVRIAAGTVPDALLQGSGDRDSRNAALRQAVLDAHFITLCTGAGRLPGWSLCGAWTRGLRAAVAHNLQLGCLSGWEPYERTEGDTVEIVRALAWDFFCGRAALLAQSLERFEEADDAAFRDAARSFPPIRPDDDGDARYIVAGGQRRRVDRR